MAIALDATSNGSSTAVTSKTVAHTCTGANRILFVSVTCIRAANGDQISGVTYNGVAMTQIGKRSSQANTFVYLYRLEGPATGTNNIVASANNSSDIGIVAASYTGAKQSGQPDSSAVANGTAASYSASTTVVASGCWLVAANVNNGGGFAAGSGATSRGIIAFSGGSQNMLVDSNATVGTGSQSLGVTLTNDNYAYVVASMAPAAETNVSVTVLDATADIGNVTFTASSNVSVSVLDSTADMGAVTPAALQSISVSVLESTADMGNVTILAEPETRVSVSVLDTSGDMGDVTVSLAQSVALGPLDATADMPDVTFTQSSNVFPSALDATADMPTPVRNGGLWANDARNSTSWSSDGRNSTSWTLDSRNIE
jgi:hypothetical protein